MLRVDFLSKYVYYVIKHQREIHNNEHSVYVRFFKIDDNHPIMTDAYDSNDYLYTKDIFELKEEHIKEIQELKEQVIESRAETDRLQKLVQQMLNKC